MGLIGRGSERDHTTRRIHEEPAVDRAARELARALAGGATLPEDWPRLARGEPLLREVDTHDGTWIVRAERLAVGDPGDAPAVVVVVERADDRLPSDEELRRVRGLTPKEARVARLLAARRSNDEIARELFISPHTARHHTESVLQKLGLRSRAQVRAALLAAADEARERGHAARIALSQAS
ncbi:MAG: helix-turn-helix transcriptional regulator [Gemmatimonadetes bacterium]|nr:helix-turn-helix transcriptional regulator [Gemmatimonadota bacterium]